MNLNVHVHEHHHCSKALAAQNALLNHLLERTDLLMSALETLTAAVATNKSAIASAITLLQGLKAALDAAILALPDTTALTALSDDLGTQDHDLAAAVLANTPTPVVVPPVPGASTTTLSANANPAAIGATVTLAATVSGANPTGTVSFLDGTSSLGIGSLTAGAATLDTTFTSVEPHNLTAEYSGNAANAPSTSNAVDLVVSQ
jgi:hypothetical protein